MASLISSDERFYLTGALNDHFDTFARNVVIWKKAPATPSVENASVFPGYSDASNFPDTTYTLTSGIYPALRVSKNDQEVFNLDEIKATIAGKGLMRIKVKEDAKNFIENGPNEKVEIDGFSFNFTDAKHVQNYLGLVFYWYYVQATS